MNVPAVVGVAEFEASFLSTLTAQVRCTYPPWDRRFYLHGSIRNALLNRCKPERVATSAGQFPSNRNFDITGWANGDLNLISIEPTTGHSKWWLMRFIFFSASGTTNRKNKTGWRFPQDIVCVCAPVSCKE